ncbi:MAG: methyl-accepting chemotaxis protein [Acidobacteria bacterium]|nr:methyl-accepting chemotaxis protein [Acidobacteriota bacterium]
MGWFTNLKTKSKLLLGFGAIVVLLGVVVAVAYQGTSALDQSQRSIVDQEFRASVDVMQIRSHVNHQRGDMFELLYAADKVVQAAHERDITERQKEIHRLVADVGTILGGRNDSEDIAAVAEVKNLLAEFYQFWMKDLGLVHQGQMEEARALGFGTQTDRMNRIRETLASLIANLEKDTAAAVAKSQQGVRDTSRIFGIVAVLALGFGVFMVWLMNRLIAVPLKAVTGVAQRIAAGDLTVQVEAEGRSDEVGAMQEALRTMVDNLRSLNKELQSGFGVLASSSTEILATVSQVAASASETATAVSETSTTAEEVKQTAHVSNQKAKNVQETAQKAAAVSETGRKAVAETLEGMNRIREQMESIAESVVRLSEQGQTIGEIIATVNDLAEQSNLLAVNAAIEASRAGEYGKGFAVVAQEVKSLAEQSRQATTQVRTILMEVQKATSAAVLATEQGTKAVAAGVKQASEAGDSIRALTGSVSEAAQAATQIAASSQQQLAGMDQIASAIANIRQATTQNMAGTKQLEASAQSLQELGGRLKILVQRQRVEA